MKSANTITKHAGVDRYGPVIRRLSKGCNAIRGQEARFKLQQAGIAALPSLVSAITTSRNFHVRTWLGKIASDCVSPQTDSSMLEIVAGGLGSKRRGARQLIARVLSRAEDGAVPFIQRALKTNDPNQKAGALQVARLLYDKARPCASLIVNALTDESLEVRANAFQALSVLGSIDDSLLDTLIEGLYDKSDRVKDQAAYLLGNKGKKAMKAVPRLAELLIKGTSGVKGSAIYAIREIASEDCLQVVKILLQNTDPIVVKQVLSRFDESQKIEAVTNLASLSTLGNDKKIRLLAINTLGGVTEDPQIVIPTLAQSLSDYNFEISDAANVAISKISQRYSRATCRILHELAQEALAGNRKIKVKVIPP